MRIKVYYCTDKGKRELNEDSLFIISNAIQEEYMTGCIFRDTEADSDALAVGLFDGIGGEAMGGEASLAAAGSVNKLCEALNEGHTVTDVVNAWAQQANQEVIAAARGRGSTTMVMVIATDNAVTVVHLGDSRGYIIRETPVYITEDHTEDTRLIRMGMEPRGNNALTRYLGMDMEGLIVEPTMSGPMSLQEGDCIVLCSDGVWGSMEQRELISIARGDDPAKALVENAMAARSGDNCSAVVLHIEG